MHQLSGYFTISIILITLTLLLVTVRVSGNKLVGDASLDWNTRFPSPTRRWVDPRDGVGLDVSGCGIVASSPCQSVGFTLQDTMASVNNVTSGLLANGMSIELADGVYTGPANRMLTFVRISLRLYSLNGPSAVVFDGQRLGRFIHLDSTQEKPQLNATSPIAYSLVEGITFFNGLGDRSGAVFMRGNTVNFGNRVIYNNCRFDGNIAQYLGSGTPLPPQAGGAVALDSVILPTSAPSTLSTYFLTSIPLSTPVDHGPLFPESALAAPTGLEQYLPSVIFSFCRFERNDADAPNTPPSNARRVGVFSNVGSYVELSHCIVTNQSSPKYLFQFHTYTRGATVFRRSNFTDSLSKLMTLNYQDTATSTHVFIMDGCIVSRVGALSPLALLIGPGLVVATANNVNVTIANTTFEYNLLPSLYIISGSTPMFRVFDSTFRYNALRAPQFIVYTTPWLIVRSKFIGNLNSYGGVGSATIVGGTASKYLMHFEDTEFESNIVPVVGGVFDLTAAVAGTNLYLHNCRFKDNFAGKSGGAIQVFSTTAMVSLIACNLTANRAFIEGGAVLINSGNVLIMDTIFTGNIAPSGGALKLPQAASDAKLNITRSTFLLNQATQGGAISVVTGAEATIHNSSFILNHAVNGGAIYMSNPPSLVWTGENLFQENVASARGGAMFIPAPVARLIELPPVLTTNLDAAASVINSCSSPFFGPITFRANRAQLIGGAIMADGDATCIELAICDIEGNTTNDLVEPEFTLTEPSSFTQGICTFDANYAGRDYGQAFGYGPVAARLSLYSNGVDAKWEASDSPSAAVNSPPTSFTAYPGVPVSISVAVVDPLNRLYGVTGSSLVGVSSSLQLLPGESQGFLSGQSIDVVTLSAIQVIRSGFFQFQDISLHGERDTLHIMRISFDVATIMTTIVLNITLANCPNGTQFRSDDAGSIGSMACVPCSPGSYNTNGMGECQLCEPETYSSSGATTCTPCPSGLRALESGADSCYEIPAPVLYSLPSTVRNVVWACASVTLAFILGCGGFIGYYWNSPVIRAASRPFLVVLLVYLAMLPLGSLLYAAVPDLRETSGEAVCIGRAWLSAFPLSGVLVVMLVKNWRLMTIFLTTKLSVQKQSDGDLAVTTTVVQALMTILLIIWSALPLSRPEIIVLKGEIGRGLSQTVVAQCSQETGFSIWMGVCIGFIALLMILNAILAFRTRNLPTQFNEASHMTFALMLLMLFGVIIVPIAFLLDDPSASIIIQGLGQTVLAGIMTCCIFAPKMYHIAQVRPDGKTVGEQNPNTIIGNGSTIDSAISPAKISSLGQDGKTNFSAKPKTPTSASTTPSYMTGRTTLQPRPVGTWPSGSARPLPVTRNPNIPSTSNTITNTLMSTPTPIARADENTTEFAYPTPDEIRPADVPLVLPPAGPPPHVANIETAGEGQVSIPVPSSGPGLVSDSFVDIVPSSRSSVSPRRIRVHWSSPSSQPVNLSLGVDINATGAHRTTPTTSASSNTMEGRE